MRFGKPIVPTDEMRSLLQKCVEWYSVDENSCGGELHVVLDDDNVDDYFLRPDECKSSKAKEIVTELLKLDINQRKWVVYNIYNVKDGEGEREILEELDDEEFRTEHCKGCVLELKLFGCQPHTRVCNERRKIVSKCTTNQ